MELQDRTRWGLVALPCAAGLLAASQSGKVTLALPALAARSASATSAR